MSRQLLLALVQLVQATIQTVLIDLLPRHSQQILQGRALIPAFGHAQLTRLGAKPGDRQQTGDPFPGNFLTTGRDQFVQQFMQTQAAPERERQVNFAKFTHPLDSNPAHLHLAPQRPLGLSQRVSQAANDKQELVSEWEKAKLEWTLVSLAYNCMRLHRLGARLKPAAAG